MAATATRPPEGAVMQTPRTLVAKLSAVMSALGYVPKNGWNDFHKYKYALESDILDAVRKSMAEHGLMLIPSVEKCELGTVPRGAPDAKGFQKTDRIATLTVRFTVTDGEKEISFNAVGEGTDAGDKATYKAMTGATKYALMKLFLIPTGDDPSPEGAADPEKDRDDGDDAPAPRSSADRVKAKVAPAAGGKPDRLKAIVTGLEALGFDTSAKREVKAKTVLGHPFNPAHEGDLTTMETWLGAQKNVKDAAEILGKAEQHRQAEFDQRSH